MRISKGIFSGACFITSRCIETTAGWSGSRYTSATRSVQGTKLEKLLKNPIIGPRLRLVNGMIVIDNLVTKSNQPAPPKE